MIYMMQLAFQLPEMEEEWNAWHTEYIHKLLSVPGFETAQRFKVLGSSPTSYMAMYSIVSPDVFDSAAYKSMGGGGSASVRFRPGYTAWRRNLLAGLTYAPAVALDEIAAIVDSSRPLGAPYCSLEVIGLDRTTPFRGVAVLSREAARTFQNDHSEVVSYTPLTPQRKSPT